MLYIVQVKGDGSFNSDSYSGDGKESLVSRHSFRAETTVFTDDLEHGWGNGRGIRNLM